MPPHTAAPTRPTTTPYSGKPTGVPVVTAPSGELVTDADGPAARDGDGRGFDEADGPTVAGVLPGAADVGDVEACGDVEADGGVDAGGEVVGVRVGVRVGRDEGRVFASLSRVFTAAASWASMRDGSGAYPGGSRPGASPGWLPVVLMYWSIPA
jgi:hypothetical protein